MPQQLTILIADDDDDILSLLRVHLERAGFKVIAARDGLQAIEQIAKMQPHLVILDWMMPNLDGVEACRRIRQVNKQIYIMMLSAMDTDEQKAIALEAGANDYQTKPIPGKKLVALVREILAVA